MPEIFSDIFTSLRQDKLRTFLTGSSMVWGMLILIVLLGCGNGFKNAVKYNHSSVNLKTISIFPAVTTVPYNGFRTGRRVVLNENTARTLKENLPQISCVAAQRTVWSAVKSVGYEYVNGIVFGISPEWNDTENCKAIKGRLLNMRDCQEKRKVVVLHRKNAELLFNGSDPIGKFVTINRVSYLVVGVFDIYNDIPSPPDLIPIQTMDMIYPVTTGYNKLILAVDGMNTFRDCDRFEEKLRAELASILEYDPGDRGAVWMWNNMSSYLEDLGIFNGIDIFLWLIGLGTLVSGIVGISNIMLITVKEKTREFGIRNILGASPGSVMRLIITESLMIAFAFGFMGMMLGICLIELLAKAYPTPGAATAISSTTFVNPEIDVQIALGALVIMTAAGVLASIVPARRTFEIKPIEALRYDR